MKEVEGKKTRGMCYVETRDGRSARVRQIDDGSIHYEVIGEEGWKEDNEDDRDREEGEGGWEDDIREEWKGERRDGRIIDARVREDIEERKVKKRLEELRELMENEEGEGDRREDVNELVNEYNEDISEKWMIGKGLNTVYEYHITERDTVEEGLEDEDVYEEWGLPAADGVEEEIERINEIRIEKHAKRKEEKIQRGIAREEERERRREEKEDYAFRKNTVTIKKRKASPQPKERDADSVDTIAPQLNDTVDNLSIEKKTEPVQDEITAGINWLNF